ncbi:DinB family protein [Hydrogenimonas sp.]
MRPFLPPPSLHGDDSEAKRREILRYFRDSYDTFESLFSLLRTDDAFYHRPEPLRHPHIFYFGHTAVFFVNKLILGKVIEKRIDPKLESIFAVGVDEMSWDDLDESHYDWPAVSHTRRYRQKVRELVEGLIETLPLSLPITQDSPWWILLMGIEHERIHIETSSVLMRQTPLSLLRDDESWPICPYTGPAPQNGLVAIEGATVRLGKGKGNDRYGWDNEYGTLEVAVPDFEAARYLVSHGEFLPFVEEGGYEERRWWSEEGWGGGSPTKERPPPLLCHGGGGW